MLLEEVRPRAAASGKTADGSVSDDDWADGVVSTQSVVARVAYRMVADDEITRRVGADRRAYIDS